MMERRNLELEAEALKMLSKKNDMRDHNQDEDDKYMKVALQASIDHENDIRKSMIDIEEAELQEAIAMSLRLQEEQEAFDRQQKELEAKKVIEQSELEQKELYDKLQLEKQKQQELLQKVLVEKQRAKESQIEMDNNEDLRRLETEKLKVLQEKLKKNELPPLKGNFKPKQVEQVNAPVAPTQTFIPAPTINMKDRLEAMKKQKELLIQSKKQEREQDLQQYKENTPIMRAQPELILEKQEITDEDKKRQEMRDVLAKKLKEDLLNKQTTSNEGVLDLTEKLRMVELQRKAKEREEQEQKKELIGDMFKNIGQSNNFAEFNFAERK
jgi:hypothetical protein